MVFFTAIRREDPIRFFASNPSSPTISRRGLNERVSQRNSIRLLVTTFATQVILLWIIANWRRSCNLLEETTPREMLEDTLDELYHEDKVKKKIYCLACRQKFDNREKVVEHLNSNHKILVLRHTSSPSSDKNAPSYEANLVDSSEKMTSIPPPIAWIVCESREVAIHIEEELSKLPEDHFLKCFSPFRSSDGGECLAVESHTKNFYPVSGHLCETAIKHIIKMAIDLYSKGKMHGNFDEKTLVEVAGCPKLHCVPKLYDSLGEGIEKQQYQLCNLMDHIVGGTELQDSNYKHFRKHLLDSRTLDDLQSMLYHPYVTRPTKLPFYYVNCHMILQRTSKLDHKTKMNRMLGDRVGDFKWISRVDGCRSVVLREALNSRMKGVENIKYHDTAFEFHTYLWDLMRHVHDKKAIHVESVRTLQEIHLEVVKLFPDYVQKMFEYMHSIGLNCHFGPEDYALPVLGQAETVIEMESFSIANLTATCQMISYMLAKFYPLCGDVAAKKVKAVAKEVEQSIEGLKTIKEKYRKCALFRISTWKKLSSKDKALLTSVRFVVGALWLISYVIKDQETSDCIMNALKSTLTDFQRFYQETDLLHFYETEIPELKKLAGERAQWPIKMILKKLVGESFIIKSSVRLSLEDSIKGLRTRLVEMLDA